MKSINVNPTNYCIQLICGAGETDVSFQVSDIYAAWKDWFLEGDNSKYLQAMESSGGEPVGGGESFGSAYFVLRSNGWKVCPITVESSVKITLVGNLFVSPSTEDLFEYDGVVGKCFIEIRTSTLPTILETGVSGLTPTESNNLATINEVQILSNQILALNQKMNKLIKLIPAAL